MEQQQIRLGQLPVQSMRCPVSRVDCRNSTVIPIFRLPCRALRSRLCSNRGACMFVWSTRGHVTELGTPAVQVFCCTAAARDFDSWTKPCDSAAKPRRTGQTQTRFVAEAAANVGVSRLSVLRHLACSQRCRLRRKGICGSLAVKLSHQHKMLRSDGNSSRSSLVSCMCT